MIRVFAVGAFAVTVLVAGAAAAQEETVAAGRIQNTFDANGRPTPRATPARTEADVRSEPAIRAFVGGLQTGTVDWSVFTPNVVEQLRPAEAQMSEAVRGLGALESVEFFQHRDGADLFLVRFAEADTQWIIGFDEAGKIAALMFRPAPPIQHTPEAAPAE
ncbi:MAG TPA: hypothetical protein VGR32_03320 [Brevundimonas sp.]|jgi:hypothetical protein|uniref:hypothetical protein n=1 Tax=Brevundimonas sp. TaxID=1871086 RepID=UPI002DEEE7EE|nr:hypothetical protein [Brevundimonas sp.]